MKPKAEDLSPCVIFGFKLVILQVKTTAFETSRERRWEKGARLILTDILTLELLDFMTHVWSLVTPVTNPIVLTVPHIQLDVSLKYLVFTIARVT